MRICVREKFIKSKSSLLFAFSVFWFALRVIPKPSRILYPCQRTTLTLIFAKLGIGVGATCLTLTKFAKQKLVKLLIIAVLLTHLCLPFVIGGYYQIRYLIISHGRIQCEISNNKVIRVRSNDAANWDFSTGYYWEYVNQSAVNRMVEEGVKAFTNTSNEQTAWQIILSNYTSGDTVGIKINGNDFWNSRLDEINTLPQVINAVVKGLKSIGVPESDIWVIEPSDGRNRYFYDYYYDTINALYPDVSLLDNDDVSFGTYPELRVSFPYTSDHYITDQMYEIDHLIMIPIVKAITPIWGVTGAIKIMQGNIESPGDFHGTLARTSADNPNVLMYQNPHVIGKVRLIVGDGLFGTWTGIHFDGHWGGIDTLVSPNHRDDVPNAWITFGNGAPNVLFFGIDPVAIDCVMYDHLLNERNAQDQLSGQSMAQFQEPQLFAGEAADLGIREHAPYLEIEYVEIELGEA